MQQPQTSSAWEKKNATVTVKQRNFATGFKVKQRMEKRKKMQQSKSSSAWDGRFSQNKSSCGLPQHPTTRPSPGGGETQIVFLNCVFNKIQNNRDVF